MQRSGVWGQEQKRAQPDVMDAGAKFSAVLLAPVSDCAPSLRRTSAPARVCTSELQGLLKVSSRNPQQE